MCQEKKKIIYHGGIYPEYMERTSLLIFIVFFSVFLRPVWTDFFNRGDNDNDDILFGLSILLVSDDGGIGDLCSWCCAT